MLRNRQSSDYYKRVQEGHALQTTTKRGWPTIKQIYYVHFDNDMWRHINMTAREMIAPDTCFRFDGIEFGRLISHTGTKKNGGQVKYKMRK